MTPARSRTLTIAFALPLALAAGPRAGRLLRGSVRHQDPARLRGGAQPRVGAPDDQARTRNPRAERRSRRREIEANLALKAAQAGKDPVTLALQDATLRRGDIVSGPTA